MAVADLRPLPPRRRLPLLEDPGPRIIPGTMLVAALNHAAQKRVDRVAQARAFRDSGTGERSAISPDNRNVTTSRRLAAILAADVAGYSRLMGADEEGTLDRLKAHRRELVDPKITEHHGRIVKTTGDGMLAEFASVVDAVRCAAEMQRGDDRPRAEVPDDRRIRFRIGINLGDIIVDGDDIFGDGVNVAARLEALAEPGGICISRTVRDQIRDRLALHVRGYGRAERQEHRAAGAGLRTAREAVASAEQPIAPATARSRRMCGCRAFGIGRRLRVPLAASTSYARPSARSSRRACRSSCCRSPISATTPSSNISPTGSPRI